MVETAAAPAAAMLREIRAAVMAADGTERELYAERRAAAIWTRSLLLITIAGTLFLTALLGLAVALTTRRRMLELQTVNAALVSESRERELVEAQLRPSPEDGGYPPKPS